MNVRETQPSIISLRLVREREQQQKCRHLNVEVDESLATLLCTDCGAAVNPIAFLGRLARHEIEFSNYFKAYSEALTHLKDKNRVKCQHCGRFTPIKKILPSNAE